MTEEKRSVAPAGTFGADLIAMADRYDSALRDINDLISPHGHRDQSFIWFSECECERCAKVRPFFLGHYRQYNPILIEDVVLLSTWRSLNGRRGEA